MGLRLPWSKAKQNGRRDVSLVSVAGDAVSMTRASFDGATYDRDWDSAVIERARNLYANNAYAQRLVDSVVDQVVGVRGVNIRAATGGAGRGRGTNGAGVDVFKAAQHDELPFVLWQQHVVRRLLIDGEYIAVVEQAQDALGPALHGVDPIIAQFPGQQNPPSASRGREPVRLSRGNFIHVFKLEYPDQLRGRSALTKAFRALDLLDKMEEAIPYNLVVTAREGEYWIVPTSALEEIGVVLDDDDIDESERAARMQRVLDRLSQMITTRPGQSPVVPEGIERKATDRGTNYHYAAYPVLRKGILAYAARCVGISPVRLSGDLDDANYSSLRQADLADQATFRSFQLLLAHCITQGFMLYFGREVELTYDFPGFASIDPAKEAAADRLNLVAGIDSPQNIMRRKGLDPDQIQQERQEWGLDNGTNAGSQPN